MAEKYVVGNLTKVIVLYEKQYWKEKGYSGEIISDSYDDPIMSCFDDTKMDDEGNIKQPALIVFVGAQVYRYWKERGDMGERVCEKIAEAFECEELKYPQAVEWFEFDEQSTIGGGPVSILGPGGLSHIQNLRKP
jgi:monoamine oxidase